MSKILVWDLPARVIHWGFAASLVAAIGCGFLGEDVPSLFQLHMIFGIIAMFLLILRIALGLAGSRYSRFSSYPLRPREILEYGVSAIVSKTKLYAGNNPGSALAAVAMFLLVPALVLSGIESGNEAAEELHELFAWALLAVIATHLAGLAWHTFRHRENIALAMITGKKTGNPVDAISSTHLIWGVMVLIGAGLWIAALFAGYNSKNATVTIPGIGVTLQLAENESGDDDD